MSAPRSLAEPPSSSADAADEAPARPRRAFGRAAKERGVDYYALESALCQRMREGRVGAGERKGADDRQYAHILRRQLEVSEVIRSHAPFPSERRCYVQPVESLRFAQYLRTNGGEQLMPWVAFMIALADAESDEHAPSVDAQLLALCTMLTDFRNACRRNVKAHATRDEIEEAGAAEDEPLDEQPGSYEQPESLEIRKSARASIGALFSYAIPCTHEDSYVPVQYYQYVRHHTHPSPHANKWPGRRVRWHMHRDHRFRLPNAALVNALRTVAPLNRLQQVHLTPETLSVMKETYDKTAFTGDYVEIPDLVDGDDRNPDVSVELTIANIIGPLHGDYVLEHCMNAENIDYDGVVPVYHGVSRTGHMRYHFSQPPDSGRSVSVMQAGKILGVLDKFFDWYLATRSHRRNVATNIGRRGEMLLTGPLAARRIDYCWYSSLQVQALVDEVRRELDGVEQKQDPPPAAAAAAAAASSVAPGTAPPTPSPVVIDVASPDEGPAPAPVVAPEPLVLPPPATNNGPAPAPPVPNNEPALAPVVAPEAPAVPSPVADNEREKTRDDISQEAPVTRRSKRRRM